MNDKNVRTDDETFEDAWRGFMEADRRIAPPPDLQRRTIAAWRAARSQPIRRVHPGNRSRLWVAAAAAILLLAAGLRLATTPDSPPQDAVWTRLPEASRPNVTAEVVQLVRVRMPRTMLPAVGVVISGPEQPGLVEVDLLVGEDGFPRGVRRVAAIQDQQQ